MKKYLVMVCDPRPRHGWFAYSGAYKDRKKCEESLEYLRCQVTPNGKPIKAKILEFWDNEE